MHLSAHHTHTHAFDCFTEKKLYCDEKCATGSMCIKKKQICMYEIVAVNRMEKQTEDYDSILIECDWVAHQMDIGTTLVFFLVEVRF